LCTADTGSIGAADQGGGNQKFRVDHVFTTIDMKKEKKKNVFGQ
jgi:hypothetical protein